MLLIRFIDLFTFTPWQQLESIRVCVTLACGSWMYLWSSLKKSFNTFKKGKRAWLALLNVVVVYVKGRLEDKWHDRFPWPRYSGKLTLWHCRSHPFSC